MNANELADELDWHWDNDCRSPAISKSADMLRQQQTEIEALKLQLHTTLTNRDLRTYDGKLDTDNEPVAWYDNEKSNGIFWKENIELDNGTPLYTHPADLTDEEILKMAANMFHYSEYRLVIEFARAILRKAQE